MKWLSFKCRAIARQLTLLATGDLGDEERAVVHAHLAKCAACRTKFQELQEIVAGCRTVSRLPNVDPSPKVRERWNLRIVEEGQSQVQPTGLVPGPRLAWGSLAAIWLLVICFRFLAPPVSVSAMAAAPVSLREALMALTIDSQGHADREMHTSGEERVRPKSLSPHSEQMGRRVAKGRSFGLSREDGV